MREDYITRLNTLQIKKGALTKDLTKEITDNAKIELSSFIETLNKIKEEEEYTYEDWYYKALSEYENKDYKTALIYLNKSLKIMPDNSNSLSLRSNANYHLGEFKDALSDADKLLSIDPDSFQYLENRGTIFLAMLNYKEAIKIFKDLIDKMPNDILYYCSLAEAYLLDNKLDLALEIIERSKSLEDKDDLKLVQKYLQCIIYKLNNMDTSNLDAEFEKMLNEQEWPIIWSIKDIEKWLKTTNIDREDKDYIEKKNKKLIEKILDQ